MNSSQVNCTITDKEFLTIVFAIEKFRQYLMGAKVIVHTDHAALCYLMRKNNSKARLMRWLLLLQEFDIDIQNRKEVKIKCQSTCLVWRRRGGRIMAMKSMTPSLDEQILAISMKEVSWFADLANFLMCGIIPDEFFSNQRKKLKRDCQDYYSDEPYLFRICTDRVIRRCVPEEEQTKILGACHSSPYGGHHSGARAATKVLSCGFLLAHFLQ
ncbi:uncharacterized protein [Nicotiana sylvestris]|uniref:uncharacterized protein n=1 Tax=Nicotiana sylvestris TaxID=4096 RepID=UPI00388C52B1